MVFLWIERRREAEHGHHPAVDARGAPIRTPNSPPSKVPRSPRPHLDPPPVGPPRQFRIDRRNTGRSPYAGPREGVIAWASRVGSVISAQPVATASGRIYVGSHDHYFYAFDSHGRIEWKKNLGDKIYSTAFVDSQGNVYVGSDADAVWSFRPDGTLRWKLDTEGDADTGITDAPDGTLRFGAGNDLWAVGTDGTVKWRFRARGKVFTAPAVDVDGTTYVGSFDDHLYAVAPDGAMRWSFAAGNDIEGAPVIGDDGTVYFGCDDKKVYALDHDGNLRWAADVDGYVRAPLALTLDGAVIVGVYGPRPRVVALETADGTLRWYFPVRVADSPEVGIASGVLVDRDGNLYFGGHDDYIYGLDSEGRLRWALPTQGDVDSSPVLLEDGTLLIGADDGELRAIRAP
jgi:outer membrane protein assembly factor BamB